MMWVYHLLPVAKSSDVGKNCVLSLRRLSVARSSDPGENCVLSFEAVTGGEKLRPW
ncbi:hypothetical protein Hanom_Chr08g00723671 [Helianthus anomalus]